MISITHSFLNDRTQFVKMSEQLSAVEETRNGTPQGTLLGPIFWLIYINNLSPPAQTIKYADDLTLIPHDTEEMDKQLQTAIVNTSEWCNQNNMIANANKSVTMSFSNIHNKWATEPQPLIMNKETIQLVTKTKFLGVVFDEHLTFSDHIDNIIRKTRPLMYTLVDLKRSGLPPPALRQFYLTCIRPIILYASPAWFSMTADYQRHRITRIENTMIKVIDWQGADYDERLVNVRIPPITSLMEEQSRIYIARIQTNETHCLHKLSKPKQVVVPIRRSARLQTQSPGFKYRTELRGKCPFIQYFRTSTA